MRKILILMLAIAIVLSSVAMASAGAFDEADGKLLSFAFPKTLENREIYHENNSSRLMAFSSDKSLEFGVDFNTDANSSNLIEIDHEIYQDGDTLFEIFELDGDTYRTYVKCNGTDDLSSLPDKVDEAEFELIKFNLLNDIRPVKIS